MQLKIRDIKPGEVFEEKLLGLSYDEKKEIIRRIVARCPDAWMISFEYKITAQVVYGKIKEEQDADSK